MIKKRSADAVANLSGIQMDIPSTLDVSVGTGCTMQRAWQHPAVESSNHQPRGTNENIDTYPGLRTGLRLSESGRGRFRG